MEFPFANWATWEDRNSLEGMSYPGVYALAISVLDLSGKPFFWSPSIIYIGMTCARKGLKQRLKQFDNTIKGKEGHGGGQRVRFKHRDYDSLVDELYVSICKYNCDITSNKPFDLRMRGKVLRDEYECFALYAEKFGKVPEFNDMKRSPKK